MATVFEWYKEQPGWAKGLLVVSVVGITIYTGFKIYGGIRTAIRKAQASKSIADVAGERKDLENSGISASFANSDYKGWATSIEKQFEGCDFFPAIWIPGGIGFSRSGKLVYDILGQFKNNVDFLKLVEAWGIRTYDACGFSGNVENVNLYGAITDELSTSEIDFLNELLASKGITYKL